MWMHFFLWQWFFSCLQPRANSLGVNLIVLMLLMLLRFDMDRYPYANNSVSVFREFKFCTVAWKISFYLRGFDMDRYPFLMFTSTFSRCILWGMLLNCLGLSFKEYLHASIWCSFCGWILRVTFLGLSLIFLFFMVKSCLFLYTCKSFS